MLRAYFTPSKERYTHTAMFVGKQTNDPSDPGGITCHTVCRFEGLTEAFEPVLNRLRKVRDRD